jgi:glucose-1-phosphate thymidylyltransferase
MNELVGLIPAAGLAKRLAPLPGSKEMFPVGFKEGTYDGRIAPCPKPVSEYVLERMRDAGARRVYIVLSHAKWDLIRYYGNGDPVGVHLAYLYVDQSPGMPYTLNQAYPWLAGRDTTVLFGMPDTIFWPYDAFGQLLSTYHKQQADLVLGVFPTDQPERFSVVSLDEQGRVQSVMDKPKGSALRNTWGIACWGSAFTELLNRSLLDARPSGGEIVLAEVFQRAVDKGLAVYGQYFAGGTYIDIGVAEDLYNAVRRFAVPNGGDQEGSVGWPDSRQAASGEDRCTT